jgi:hypothetical protein
VEHLPSGGEVREVFGFKDLPEIDFNEGGPREARVVAHEAEPVAIGAEAPEGVIGLIEPVLQSGRGGAAESFARE